MELSITLKNQNLSRTHEYQNVSATSLHFAFLSESIKFGVFLVPIVGYVLIARLTGTAELRGWVNYYGRYQSGNALGISTHESYATRVDDEKVQKVQTATQAGLELAHTDCEAGTQTFRPMGEELFKLGWIMGAG